MDDVQKVQGENPIPDSEELKQEEEILKEVKQDEVRAQIIEKYGFDETLEGEVIDKLVNDTLEQRKALGKAIQQKRKYRELAGKPKPESEPKKQDAPVQPQSVDVSALVQAELEKRDLEALDLPDELKDQVSKLAKLQGVSVRQAAKDPYILHQKEQIEAQKKTDEAAISRTRKGTATNTKFDPNTPPDVDMTTEEGRKTWEEYKKFLATQNS